MTSASRAVRTAPAAGAQAERATALADDRNPDEPFIQRWARRKADAAQVETEDRSAEDAPIETASVEGAPPARADDQNPADGKTDDAPEIDPSTLPDVDSLEADSDFSVFMQNGVPEELQKRALQRLWRLDPSFGHIDGLLEYGEDFTGNGLVAEAVNTVYKVGKGMVSDDAEVEPVLPEEDETPLAASDDGPDEDGPAPNSSPENESSGDDVAGDRVPHRDIDSKG
jgi:hypothetical protein